ncbi:MAG: tetratricopeptide repeat protein [Candidatus Brocadiales bacterium]|nr:tetratricopeptide repeat protein [Candidatus Brocadiales bacterium]
MKFLNIKLEKLKNEELLIKAEKEKIEKEKILLEINNDKLIKEFANKKNTLEEEYRAKNIQLVNQFEKKNIQLVRQFEINNNNLEGKYKEKNAKLDEEYTKLEEDVKSMASFTNLYDQGVGAYTNKRYNEAISFFTASLSKKAPNDSKAYALNYRGAIYLKINKDKEALADFEASAVLKPENPRPYHNMAVIYFKRKDYKKAYEEYKEAIRLYNIDGEDNTAYVLSKDLNDLFKRVEGEEEIKASIKKNIDELGQKLFGS